MADTTGDWSTNSTDAVTISLVVPAEGGSKTLASFNPKFTYPIFGDEESIFGYQGLKIHLKYHASDMRPNVQVSYNKRFKAQGEVEPTDIKAVLEDFLPNAAFEKSSIFETNIKSDLNKDWKPPGELLKSFNENGETYEIWKGSLADKAVQQVLKRIQILVSFFIEGGTFIDLEDPDWSLERWTIFFLYKKDSQAPTGVSPYTFMGYSTVYHYYLLLTTPPDSPNSNSKNLDFELPFPDMSIQDTPRRTRISQFIVLPSAQGAGHGSRLYETIFQQYLNDPRTIDITVEDPNEAFDDLRDYNDLVRLRTVPEFASMRINTSTPIRNKGPVPTSQLITSTVPLHTIRSQQKIAPRQFGRLVEMQLLSLIPTYIRASLLLEKKEGSAEEIKKKEHEYRLWQLLCKERLYRHNKMTLMQLDRAERIDKLEEAVSSVEADYARMLRALDAKKEGKLNGKSSKRPREADDEVEDEEGEPSKKARVEDE